MLRPVLFSLFLSFIKERDGTVPFPNSLKKLKRKVQLKETEPGDLLIDFALYFLENTSANKLILACLLAYII